MALIRNGSNPTHWTVAALRRGRRAGLRSALDRSGQRKNFDSGEHAVANVTNKAAIPEGFRHPMSWKMGTKAGSLSSHVEGRHHSRRPVRCCAAIRLMAAPFTISTNTPAGQLIVSGTGSTDTDHQHQHAIIDRVLGGTGSVDLHDQQQHAGPQLPGGGSNRLDALTPLVRWSPTPSGTWKVRPKRLG